MCGQGLTTRLECEIDAFVSPGNSGGPLIDMIGQVFGIVFSRSTTNPDVGFALASPTADQEIVGHESATKGVASRACVSYKQYRGGDP